MIKLPLRNGQENGLRSRGLVHPEHALCLAELCPDEIGPRYGRGRRARKRPRGFLPITLGQRLEMVDGVGIEPTFTGLQPAV
jgi:hypothetical protein